jgi:hypothetical protein
MVQFVEGRNMVLDGFIVVELKSINLLKDVGNTLH